jgi:hypothetical protein
VLKDKTRKRELFAERGLAHMSAWRDAHALVAAVV